MVCHATQAACLCSNMEHTQLKVGHFVRDVFLDRSQTLGPKQDLQLRRSTEYMNHVGLQKVAEGNIVFSPDGSMPLPLTEPCHLNTLQFKRSTQSMALAARRPSSATRHSHSLTQMEALYCRYLQLKRRWLALTPPTRCGPEKADRLFPRVGSRVAPGWDTEPYFDGCRKQTTRKTEYVRHARTLLGSHEAAHNPGAFFHNPI